MAQGQLLTLRTQLLAAQGAADQVVVLRTLKNYIIGYEERKVICAQLGMLEHIVGIARADTKYRNGKETRMDPVVGQLSAVEEARLQALTVLGSLAHGMCLSSVALFIGCSYDQRGN